MNNLYQEAEELVFKNRPPRYRLDIQSDRANHKDTRLLQHHSEFVVKEAERIEKYLKTLKPVADKPVVVTTAKNLHSNLPPNPIDQTVPHGVDLDWN